MRQKLSFVVCLALVLSCLSLTAGAQQPSASIAESIDINVVNVDLYVSDKKGNPITGLSAKDFQLFEDEKKVKITNFSPGGDPEEKTSLIIYVDNSSVSASSRDRVLDVVVPFVERVMTTEGTAVMVVRFDRRLYVEQDFTTDPAAVRLAVDTIKLTEPGESTQARERSFRADAKEAMELLQGGGPNSGVGRTALDGVFASAMGFGASQRASTILSVEALTALARSLGIRPGRKSLVFIGDGLALRPMSDMMASFQRQIVSRQGGSGTSDASESGVPSGRVPTTGGQGGLGSTGAQGFSGPGSQASDSGSERFQETLEQLKSTGHFQRLGAIANASRVTLYPIKPPYVDASDVGQEKRSSDTEQPISNMREALELMADATGGQSMVAGTDVAAYLDTTREAVEARYSLGFAPREKGQGRLHLLRLKGKSRSWQLRYRQSYVQKSLLTRLADRAVGALTVQWVDNPHEIGLEVTSEAKTADGTYDVTVMMALPISALSLIEEGGFSSANCQVAVVVLNPEGQLSRPQYLQLPIRIPTSDLANALAQNFGGALTLRVSPGVQSLAVGLWETGAGKGSFLSQEITVGES